MRMSAALVLMCAALLGAVLLCAGCGATRKGEVTAQAPTTPQPAGAVSKHDAAVLARLPKGSRPYEERFSGGGIKASGYVCDGKPIGPWVMSWDKGGKRSEGAYLYGGLRDGDWTYWFENGRTSAKGSYERGKEHGGWEYWHETGAKAMEGDYFRGDKEGEWQSWHEDGSKASSGRFARDKRVGHWDFWNQNGSSAGAVGYQIPRP